MEGLLGYGSGSDSSHSPAAERPDTAAVGEQEATGNAVPPTASDSEEDSYFGNSGSDSDDSYVQRRRAAEERLRDYGEEAVSSGLAGPSGATERDGSDSARPLLPAAIDALTQLEGPKPAFLNPEATRPVAQSIHRHRRPPPKPVEEAPAHKGRRKRGPGEDWDISMMAPKAKGEAPAQAKGVITAAAVRINTGDDDGACMVTAAQVALMGGQWKPSADPDDSGGDGGARTSGAARPPGSTPAAKRKTPSTPMGVSEFLDRGIGGATLPRSRGDRKDKEKEKRGKGQSTASHWKSEAEMVLRQQYDS
eukprot:CAMPEP_0206141326 /NCGR_PEP_ID=MMETSP1473-20131121/12551_1 /ASSEMBLY_ACC=CAM_ASM_001109 /TAXON_ID=1461547 /ORGANISM="Stichococcus sp, Strain RCC1054" /LENGTH=306 /DNA_ID=CAMNT_0053535845 /DNA_START=120 /DNA_END=1040 /DNA_ORIENTATION=-